MAGSPVVVHQHSPVSSQPCFSGRLPALPARSAHNHRYFKRHPSHRRERLPQRSLHTQASFLPQRQRSSTDAAPGSSSQHDQRTEATLGLGGRLREAVFQGLRLTSLALRLASNIAHTVVTEAQRAFHRLEAEQQQQAAQQAPHSEPSKPSAPERLAALAAQQRDAVLSMSRRAADSGFIKMLHSLGDPRIPLERKWAELGKHVQGGEDEFSTHLDKLFQVAGESSKAMQELLSKSGDGLGSSSAFLKSAHTVSVIAEEEAFKALVFSQMLGAT